MNVPQPQPNSFQLVSFKYESLTARVQRIRKQCNSNHPNHSNHSNQNQIFDHCHFQSSPVLISKNSQKQSPKQKIKLTLQASNRLNIASQRNIRSPMRQNLGIGKSYVVRRSQSLETRPSNISRNERYQELKKALYKFSYGQIDQSQSLTRKGIKKYQNKQAFGYPYKQKIEGSLIKKDQNDGYKIERIKLKKSEIQQTKKCVQFQSGQSNQQKYNAQEKYIASPLQQKTGQFRNSTDTIFNSCYQQSVQNFPIYYQQAIPSRGCMSVNEKNRKGPASNYQITEQKASDKQSRQKQSDPNGCYSRQKSYNSMSRQKKYCFNSASQVIVRQKAKGQVPINIIFCDLEQSFKMQELRQHNIQKKSRNQRQFIPGKIYRSNRCE